MKIVVNALRLTLILAIAVSIFYQSWSNLFISCLALVLTFIPFLIEKKYQIDIPIVFELVVILFVYASLFLGEVGRFFHYFWWWDLLLHGTSAVAFASIGFIILFILSETSKIEARPGWLAVFSFSFAVAIGVIWEIFEFFMDQTLGLNMQKSGLVDTMWDLIINNVGAILTSLAGYEYMTGKKRPYISRIFDLLLNKNSD